MEIDRQGRLLRDKISELCPGAINKKQTVHVYYDDPRFTTECRNAYLCITTSRKVGRCVRSERGCAGRAFTEQHLLHSNSSWDLLDVECGTECS